MNATVLGCGRWGSFIAWYLNKLGFSVTLWGRPGSARLKALCETRDNGLLTFPSTVKFTDDLKQAVSEAELLFISISAQSLRTLTASLQPLLPKNTPVILCMKGIEEATGLRLTQIVGEFISAPTAVWVGPGHVQDFLQGIPNCMVIDSQDDTLKQRLVPLLSSELIRFYYGTDLIGSEVGAAAKNVVGIAAGMLDGLADHFCAELGPETKFYATGNLPTAIRDACRTPILYRETLITDGLYCIWLRNRR